MCHPKLEDGDFYSYKVMGLSTGTGDDAHGYVCFTKTRAANRKFFNFFNNSLLIPFITRLQEKLNMTGNSNCVVTCDGEAAQIDPYFSDDVQTKLDSQGVIIAKLGASATAVS